MGDTVETREERATKSRISGVANVAGDIAPVHQWMLGYTNRTTGEGLNLWAAAHHTIVRIHPFIGIRTIGEIDSTRCYSSSAYELQPRQLDTAREVKRRGIQPSPPARATTGTGEFRFSA